MSAVIPCNHTRTQSARKSSLERLLRALYFSINYYPDLAANDHFASKVTIPALTVIPDILVGMVKKKANSKARPKNPVLLSFLIVAILATASIVLSLNHHPRVIIAETITEQAQSLGHAELVTKTPYRRKEFNVLVKLDGEPILCPVIEHKLTYYAMCGEPLGAMVFNNKGELLSSDAGETKTPDSLTGTPSTTAP